MIDRTAYSSVWSYLGEIDIESADYKPPFDGLFGSRPDVERLGMSDLHAALLGWESTSFDSAIASIPRSSVNAQDLQGRTALSYAAQHRSVRIIKELLLKGADPKTKDRHGRGPLHYWALNPSEDQSAWDEMLYLLGGEDGVDHKDYSESSVLHYACARGSVNLAVLEKLVALGADINNQDYRQHDALHQLIYDGFDPDHHLDVASWLLSNGADKRAQDINGFTHVMSALIYGKVELLELLLARGADYSLPTALNCNVLLVAATCGTLESLSVLQKAEIALQNPNAEDNYGWTPMRIAQWRREHNEEWLDWAYKAPDEDPEKFFEAFKALLQSVQERSEAMDWTSNSDSASAADEEEEAYIHVSGNFPDE